MPKKMKDAAFGMGCTRAQVIWQVVLPTGTPGILTGVMLAVAGAAGESAPAVHRPVQQLLPVEPDRAHPLAVHPDLQFLGDAFTTTRSSWPGPRPLVLVLIVLVPTSRRVLSGARNSEVFDYECNCGNGGG